jgi:hypothetical protein
VLGSPYFPTTLLERSKPHGIHAITAPAVHQQSILYKNSGILLLYRYV